MYLRQITLTGGIPFAISLPKAPESINADMMSVEQLKAELFAGYEDMEKGDVQDAASAFAKFREEHR